MPEPADLNLDELKRRGRRRLIGAIVLALAAAVLVPMLLESEPKPLGDEVSVKIPPVDDGKFVNRLTDPKAKAAAAKAESAKAEAAKADAAKAEAAKADAAKQDMAKAEPTKPEAAKAESAPADSAKADTTPAPSREAAPAPKDGAPAVPPPKKSLAEAEQRVLAPNSKPVPAPAKAPDVKAPSTEPAKVAAAPVAAPAAPTPAAPPAATPSSAAATSPAPAAATNGAFVVQLAAFADDKGANALANKLKKAGYTAFTEPYTTSRGTLWRVRVGPFPTRDAAVATRDKLKAEGQNGIVASK